MSASTRLARTSARNSLMQIRSRFGIDIAVHLFDGKVFATIISAVQKTTAASSAEYAVAIGGTPIQAGRR
jgi:hypothetical protein